jgi:hypothetical protein
VLAANPPATDEVVTPIILVPTVFQSSCPNLASRTLRLNVRHAHRSSRASERHPLKEDGAGEMSEDHGRWHTIGTAGPSGPAFGRDAGTRLPARRSRLWTAIEGDPMNDGPILTGAVIVSAAVSALLVHLLLLG